MFGVQRSSELKLSSTFRFPETSPTHSPLCIFAPPAHLHSSPPWLPAPLCWLVHCLQQSVRPHLSWAVFLVALHFIAFSSHPNPELYSGFSCTTCKAMRIARRTHAGNTMDVLQGCCRPGSRQPTFPAPGIGCKPWQCAQEFLPVILSDPGAAPLWGP